ncbi:DUF6065 family protein [Yoonia sp. BS5-3]|uniref:DUF6065 family protein n=1 Tax=Yoonia phaeophyticola TaxID=3137369 RepID=A0ABZ2V7T4_9RHOB
MIGGAFIGHLTKCTTKATPKMSGNIVKFFKVYPHATTPLIADTSALGNNPTGAFQYCEPLRKASAFGWYVFPAKQAEVIFDGTDLYYADDGQWQPLQNVTLGQEFLDDWQSKAPEAAKGFAPSFMQAAFVPGVLQVWSGILVSTKEDWISLVRPVANANFYGALQCYDGVVETDAYGPWPLFINVRVTKSDVPIILDPNRPLFQLQVLPRTAFEAQTRQADIADEEAVGLGLTSAEWDGFTGTVRKADFRENKGRRVGEYAINARKSDKNKR